MKEMVYNVVLEQMFVVWEFAARCMVVGFGHCAVKYSKTAVCNWKRLSSFFNSGFLLFTEQNITPDTCREPVLCCSDSHSCSTTACRQK